MFRFIVVCFLALVTPSFSNVVQYSMGVWKLTIVNTDSGFSQDTRQRIIDTFFQVYPQIQPKFNPAVSTEVRLTIDVNYDGVAYASGGAIVASARWFQNNPKDTDLVTHELMHVVQSYPGGQPGWLVEGIADYVRWRYGRDNAGSNWSLPDFNRAHKYTDSYRVTARFLAWIERKVNGNIVTQLDSALRRNAYQNGAIWNQLTGKSVDQLWADYSNNPAF